VIAGERPASQTRLSDLHTLLGAEDDEACLLLTATPSKLHPTSEIHTRRPSGQKLHAAFTSSRSITQMSTNNPQHDEPPNEPPNESPNAIAGEAEWETVEYEQLSAGQPDAGDPTIVELPSKQRGWTRRQARVATETPRGPARARGHGEVSWITAALAAVIAAFLGAAVVSLSRAPVHQTPAARAPTRKPLTTPRHAHSQREHHHRPQRPVAAWARSAPHRGGEDGSQPVLPQAPAVAPAESLAPLPVPPQSAEGEGQSRGSPFSP
jgi:hypothetical protein